MSPFLWSMLPCHRVIGAQSFDLVVLSSRSDCPDIQPFNVRSLHCLETSGTNYPLTWHHIPE